MSQERIYNKEMQRFLHSQAASYVLQARIALTEDFVENTIGMLMDLFALAPAVTRRFLEEKCGQGETEARELSTGL